VTTEEPFREMTPRERALIDHLLAADFPGRDALRAQLSTARVQAQHPQQDECMRFEVLDRVPAATLSSRPIEAITSHKHGFPPTTFAFEVGSDGIVWALVNVRDDSRPAPPIENIHVFYQQKGQHVHLPVGVLTADYIPAGLQLGNSSLTMDFDPGEIPSKFTIVMRPIDNDRSTHLQIQQLRNYEPGAARDAQTLNLRSHIAHWWVDSEFLKLEWLEERDLIVQFQAKGLPLAELISVAESLRPARTTG